MLDSGIRFRFYQDAKNLFDGLNDINSRKLSNNFEACLLNEACVNRTDYNFATLKIRRQVLFFMRKYYTLPDGRPLIYSLSDGFVIIRKFNVRKGFPLSKKFNEIIMQLSANG